MNWLREFLSGKKTYLLGVARIIAGLVAFAESGDAAILFESLWQGLLIIAGRAAVSKAIG